jgi:hypothetical protein
LVDYNRKPVLNAILTFLPSAPVASALSFPLSGIPVYWLVGRHGRLKEKESITDVMMPSVNEAVFGDGCSFVKFRHQHSEPECHLRSRRPSS